MTDLARLDALCAPLWLAENSSIADWWTPTRNIAQALEVLEKFTDWNLCPLPRGGFECCIYLQERVSFDAEADTLPLAIVLACLKAKGVPLDQ